MSLSMSRAEREAFLAETRVAVVSVAEEGRGPLTVPVWHIYEPGAQVRFVTGGLSRKAHLIRKAPRLSLCVQTETPPYRYVSVEGPVTLGVPDYERDIPARRRCATSGRSWVSCISRPPPGTAPDRSSSRSPPSVG
jgi:hypothetical protein